MVNDPLRPPTVTLAADFFPFLLQRAHFNKIDDLLKIIYSTPFIYISALVNEEPCSQEGGAVANSIACALHTEVFRFGSWHCHLIAKLEKVLKNNYWPVLYILK